MKSCVVREFDPLVAKVMYPRLLLTPRALSSMMRFVLHSRATAGSPESPN